MKDSDPGTLSKARTSRASLRLRGEVENDTILTILRPAAIFFGAEHHDETRLVGVEKLSGCLKDTQASTSRVPVVRPVFPLTGICSPKYRPER